VKVADTRRPMAEINVTPFVDVVLVLLIIFMLTAPLLGAGLEVDLPRTATTGVNLKDELSVTLTKDGKIYIDENPVPRAAFGRAVEDAFHGTKSSRAFLRADQAVPYGTVVEILGLMREAGIENVGLVTKPADEWKPRGGRG
jgi:biopolymer transport protein TolR